MPTPWRSGSVTASADPLAGRKAVEVHAQVGVDEHVARVFEHRAHAVPGVGCHEHPLERPGLLAGDDRLSGPHPDRGGAGLPERAAHEPDVHRRVVAHVVPGVEERRRLAGAGAGRRVVGRQGGKLHVVGADPPGQRPHGHLAVGGRQRGLEQLHAAARADDSCLDGHRPDRHRPQDLVGHARDLRRSTPPVHALERAPDECGGPACCASGSHGPRVSSVATKRSPSGT